MAEAVKKISWSEAMASGAQLPTGTEVDLSTVTVTICGGGNGAHTAAAMFSSLGCKTNMYLSLKQEAERIREGVKKGGVKCIQHDNRETVEYIGFPEVSDNPEILKDSDVIVVLAPGFAHESIMKEIAPHLKKGALVGALPAHGGFDLVAKHVLGEKTKDIIMFGTVSLPWACRIVKYGREVEVLGTKDILPMSCHPRAPQVPIVQLFEQMFPGTHFPLGNDFLEVTLWPANNIIHPGILYGKWKNWDGKPVDQKPFFYVGVDDFAAEKLQKMSDEIQAIKAAAEKELQVTLNVPDLQGFMLQSYGREIPDQSSLKRIFQTNPGYNGLTHPMKKTEEETFVPDFRNRYLTEDIPHGLAVLRGIASLVNVPTPCMDEVLSWGQQACGQTYLEQGKLEGDDVRHSGAPQRFGYSNIRELIF